MVFFLDLPLLAQKQVRGMSSFIWEDKIEPRFLRQIHLIYAQLSGTNGDPKGVILTHENISTNIRGVDLFMEQFEDKMTVDDVYISFLPLAHILDRMIEEYFFHKGASVGYYHGDINELKDDLMELKPTFLAGVPRVFERIHKGVLKALEDFNWRRRKKFFDMLYKYKLYSMNRAHKKKDASPLADLLAFVEEQVRRQNTSNSLWRGSVKQ